MDTLSRDSNSSGSVLPLVGVIAGALGLILAVVALVKLSSIKKEVDVLNQDLTAKISTLEGDVLAWTYVLNGYEGGLPSARYLGVMADAAEAAGAPEDYVAALRERECRSIGP